MKKNINNRSGITLIALVITIVVILILAIVTINLTLGQNGIFQRTKQAKEQYTNAQNYETEQLNEIDIKVQQYVSGSQTPTTNTPTYVVTYNASGGTFSNNSSEKIVEIEQGSAIGEIEIPSRAGCEFLGWYRNITTTKEIGGIQQDCTERENLNINSSTVFPGEVTLYARWKKYLYNNGTGKENWTAYKGVEDFSWSTVSYYWSSQDEYIEFGDNSENDCGATALITQNVDTTYFTKLFGKFSCYSNNREISAYASTSYYRWWLGCEISNETWPGPDWETYILFYNANNCDYPNTVFKHERTLNTDDNTINSVETTYVYNDYLVNNQVTLESYVGDLQNTNNTILVRASVTGGPIQLVKYRMHQCWLET